MDRPKFVIEPSEAESMAKQSGLSSVLQLLPSLVRSAQTLARPPISSFRVGAVGLSSDGRVFVGVNLEFPGLPLHHSVHAEQFLATNLSLHRRRSSRSALHLRFLAVSDAPCGHCRQFLQEIRGAPDLRIRINTAVSDAGDGGRDGDRSLSDADFKPLSSLLPHRFGPDDLLPAGAPLLLDPRDNGLVLAAAAASPQSHPIGDNGHSCNGVSVDLGGEDRLPAAALEAANESHAPYSGCPSGVALLDCEGKLYKGSYMESAAYNPSLGPVQAAVVAYIVGGGGDYKKIAAAVLVEKKGGTVVQEHTARLLLGLISPKCEFRVVHCRLASNGCMQKEAPSS